MGRPYPKPPDRLAQIDAELNRLRIQLGWARSHQLEQDIRDTMKQLDDMLTERIYLTDGVA